MMYFPTTVLLNFKKKKLYCNFTIFFYHTVNYKQGNGIVKEFEFIITKAFDLNKHMF